MDPAAAATAADWYATTADWRQLHVALSGIVLTLGTVGNALIVAAMLVSRRHAWPVRMLLSLSSVADLFLLYVACCNRLVEETAGTNLIQSFIRHSPASCVLYHVASGFLNQLCTWLYVCMAAENYFSRRHGDDGSAAIVDSAATAAAAASAAPAPPAGMTRQERVNHGVLLLCALFLIINMSPFWTVELQKDELSSASQQKLCFYVQRFERFSTSIYPVLDLVLRAALPALVICTATAAVYCQRLPKRRANGCVGGGGGGVAVVVEASGAPSLATPDARQAADEQRRIFTALPLAFLLANAPRLLAVCVELANYSVEASSRPGVTTLLRLHGRLTDGHALADMVYFVFVSAKPFILLATSASFRTCVARCRPPAPACGAACFAGAARLAPDFRRSDAAAGPLYRCSANPASTSPLISQGAV